MINKFELLDLDLYMALLLELREFRDAPSLYAIVQKLEVVNSSNGKRESFVNGLVIRGVITEESGFYKIDQKKLFVDFLNSGAGRKFVSVIDDNSILSPWFRGKTFSK